MAFSTTYNMLFVQYQGIFLFVRNLLFRVEHLDSYIEQQWEQMTLVNLVSDITVKTVSLMSQQANIASLSQLKLNFHVCNSCLCTVCCI